jgi:hypothetical protein
MLWNISEGKINNVVSQMHYTIGINVFPFIDNIVIRKYNLYVILNIQRGGRGGGGAEAINCPQNYSLVLNIYIFNRLTEYCYFIL